MVITVDELEALRLADFLEMTQEEVARKMQVSRPTVTRMLARAHRAVAEALVNGKAICIEGGDYHLGRSVRPLRPGGRAGERGGPPRLLRLPGDGRRGRGLEATPNLGLPKNAFGPNYHDLKVTTNNEN